ncbi:MAG TPA: PEP-CTERM sorting domain-containing protein [Verrucomicrobiae bacterium]|nr:PEP-CTERM sorting domain-containing protein [Verrucomicrobiae bacterium]
MKKIVATGFLALVPIIGALAQSADGFYSAGNDLGFTNVLNSSGLSLADNSLVMYGNFGGTYTDTQLSDFGLGGLTPTELASMNAAFQPLFTWQIGDGTGDAAGTFDVSFSTNNASAFSGERMYMLVYNVTDQGSIDSATEFGLLRNDGDNGSGGLFPVTGVTPVTSGGFVDASLMTGLVGNFISGGFEMTAVVIPEPGTWALVVFGLGIVVAGRRGIRRRR